mmetsp:Transcript_15441/g.48706  ORF Transcript_15441/g.48706 Transcript_15441/m.48706 type:complete len:219 (+) Transcript_15441:982-1638(+)
MPLAARTALQAVAQTGLSPEEPRAAPSTAGCWPTPTTSAAASRATLPPYLAPNPPGCWATAPWRAHGQAALRPPPARTSPGHWQSKPWPAPPHRGCPGCCRSLALRLRGPRTRRRSRPEAALALCASRTRCAGCPRRAGASAARLPPPATLPGCARNGRRCRRRTRLRGRSCTSSSSAGQGRRGGQRCCGRNDTCAGCNGPPAATQGRRRCTRSPGRV